MKLRDPEDLTKKLIQQRFKFILHRVEAGPKGMVHRKLHPHSACGKLFLQILSLDRENATNKWEKGLRLGRNVFEIKIKQ